MSIHVLDNFIAPLRAMFGDPPGEDPEKALGFYAKALSRFSAQTLEAAADRIIATAKRRTWPMPGECADHCRAIEHEAVPVEQKRPALLNDEDGMKHEAIIRVLRRLPYAKAAADEGWIGTLYDFIRRHERPPERGEVEKCRVEAKENERVMATLNLTGSLGVALQGAGEALMARRQKIAEQVWEEA